MTSDAKTAAIVGVGPGLGRAVALRFAQGGFAVALMARSEEAASSIQAEIKGGGGVAKPFACDASDESSVRSAFARVREELGDPEVLVYNAGAFAMGGVMQLSPADLERTWRINCLGGLITAQAVLPKMVERGRGTILFSGATAALRGGAQFASLAVGKFGLRALAQSMARDLGPRGIHVAHVIIDGGIDTPRMRAMVAGRQGPAPTLLSPAAIAETYWHLHTQDPSAWTQEMDLRPSVEKF